MVAPVSLYGHTDGFGLDQNHNEMSDVFEALFPSAANPALDSDSDGTSNLEESIAGTNPLSGTSRFDFSSVNSAAETVSAQWQSTLGKRYQFQMSSTMEVGTWVDAGVAQMGTGGAMNGVSPMSGERQFIRIAAVDIDTDGDGLSDWEEYQVGTSPLVWDTDGDGRSDYAVAAAIVASPSVVNVYALQSYATEYGKTATFKFVRRGGFQALTVPFTIGGTATLGTDYTLSTSGPLVFATGVSSMTVTMTALSDAVLEDAETAILTINAGTGYTVGPNGAATVTIASQGLIGQYFNTSSSSYSFDPVTSGNFDPTQLRITRRDPGISFNWSKPAGTPPGTGNGVPGTPTQIADDDAWSAQWIGVVTPKYTEVYQIIATADRGVKVYFSQNPISSTNNTNSLRINQWSTADPVTVYGNNAQSSSEVSTRILVAGKPYFMRVDYRDSADFTNNANIDIRWSSPTQLEETIPTSALSSEAFAGTAPIISSPLVTLGLIGAPFLYPITASNTPTSYSANGLPAGLSVNSGTGQITGTLSTAGIYFPTIVASNAAGSDAKNLTIVVIGTAGNLTRQVWSTPLSGSGVSTVPVWTTPTTSTTITSLQAPANDGDDYGERIQSTITAPITGNYTFQVSSDENVELWVSSNAEPAHRLKRAWVVNGTVPPGSYITLPSQTSYLMQMKAGNAYYIEAIRRETTGSDHLSIAWIKPGDTVAEIIPAYALSPFSATGDTSDGGTLYIANMTPQNGAASLGSGTALLKVNEAKTQALLSFSYANLTGPITSQHLHDARNSPAPSGTIVFDIDDAPLSPANDRLWVFSNSSTHTIQDLIDGIEVGQIYINLHTGTYPTGEIKGFFQLVTGSQFFVPPAAPPAAELTLPSDPVARQAEIVRFLQQATFGARHDADGVAPWDPDSIEAVEALGYEGWIDAQLAMNKGTDPEVLVTQMLPSRIQYVIPTPAVPTLIPSSTDTGYNGSGPMASYVRNYYDKFPLSNVSNVGASLEDNDEIWRAWWRTSVKAPDQLRMRTAFALSQIMVVSEDGPLDSFARAVVHYYDLLYWHGTENFRTLIEKVTLNPAMGRYLDMLNNKKPNPAIGYIPNENYAREILQLFSIGLRRLHPDGSYVLNSAGLPATTYEQENVVGLAHVFTGWRLPGSGGDYITPMTPRTSDHDTAEKLLLENTIVPATTTATTASCNYELGLAHDIIFQHPNTGPFIARQLIQRMVTVNPSPGYIYRVAQKFDDNGSGVRGDMAAVIKTLLLDPEARNQAPRAQAGFGHVKEPVIRATQLLRALNGFSYGEVNYGLVNMLGMVAVSPNANLDLSQPLPVTTYTRLSSRALFPGDVVTLSNQSPSADNGLYVFNGNGLPLTRTTTGTSVATYSTDISDITTVGLPTVNYTVVEDIPLAANARLLLRNQTNPAENGIYVMTSTTLPLVRWDKADEPAELTAASVTVAAYRDAMTLAYSTKTFLETATVTTVGTSPVIFADGSATASGKRAWEMGITDGTSFEQTPLRAPTVFNFFQPDYVFLGDTGNNGLYSPEFQITSETSIVNTGNWFYEFTRRNDATPATMASPHTYGQGYNYNNPIGRDIKLDTTAEQALALDGGALVDRLGGLLMPNQMSPRLRTLLVNYINSFPETIVSAGSAWSYFTDAAGLGASNIVVGHASYNVTNWKHPSFSDAAWTSGNAILGYSSTNAGITTVIPYGGVSGAKWITSYYRKNFSVTDMANVGSLILRLKRDDGAIVYLNGREIKRDNFDPPPAAPPLVVSGTTVATGAGDNGAHHGSSRLQAAPARS